MLFIHCRHNIRPATIQLSSYR